jgi:hypothetical protein
MLRLLVESMGVESVVEIGTSNGTSRLVGAWQGLVAGPWREPLGFTL